MLKNKIKWFFLIAVLVVGLSSASVFALPSHSGQVNSDNTLTPSMSTNNQAQSHSHGGVNNSSDKSGNGSAHAAQGKLRACLNRENAIRTIISRINLRLKNQLGLFTVIAGRVEVFYSKRGETVSNYSQLLANIKLTYTVAKNQYSSLQSVTDFSCQTSHPHAMVVNFRNHLKTTIADLKAYKTAVKNLIVAVANAYHVSLTSNKS